MDKKIERIKRIHEMTDKEAAELIEKQSKKRKAYHNYFCETKWGDSRNYELSIFMEALFVLRAYVLSLVFAPSPMVTTVLPQL